MSTEYKQTFAERAVAYSAESQEWDQAAVFDDILRSLKQRGFGACAARLVDFRFASIRILQ